MIKVNGKEYNVPSKPTVIICIDGCQPEYIDRAAEKNFVPTITTFKRSGFYGIADSVIPSFTNPNNAAIITGTTPKVNGIPGNWIYDEVNNKERALETPDDLRCETILQVFSESGVKVAAITAKDKLRLLLGKGLKGINISAEMIHHVDLENGSIEDIIKSAAASATSEINIVPDAWMYSERSSHFALELAVKLLKGGIALDLIYVSLTDYIPHRYAPGSEKANDYFHKIDTLLGELDNLGCLIGITGDHGMNDKHNADGSPKVIWVDSVLQSAGIAKFKTILPITDQYGAHHGALGGLAWVHLDEVDKGIDVFSNKRGIERILRKDEAAETFNLPPDVIGDIVLLGDRDTVFGTSIERHSNIPAFLRSHGSQHEQKVPFILSKSMNNKYRAKMKIGLKNYEIFEYVLNGVEG